MNLRCKLCGEIFPADDFYAEIEVGGAILIRCPNECNLIDRQLKDLSADIEDIDEVKNGK